MRICGKLVTVNLCFTLDAQMFAYLFPDPKEVEKGNCPSHHFAVTSWGVITPYLIPVLTK